MKANIILCWKALVPFHSRCEALAVFLSLPPDAYHLYAPLDHLPAQGGCISSWVHGVFAFGFDVSQLKSACLYRLCWLSGRLPCYWNRHLSYCGWRRVLIKSSPLEGTAVYDQNRVENVTHEVQPGDTLSTIAYRYGLEIASLRYSNPDLANSDRLAWSKPNYST